MTHQNQHQRQHNRRGALHARQAKADPLKATDTHRIIPATITIPVNPFNIFTSTRTSDAASSSVSTSQSSTTIATTSATTSTTTSSPPPVPTTTAISKTPTSTPIPATRVIPTTTLPSSSPTATAAADTSSQSNTGAILGGVAGGVAALVVVSMLVAFILRRYRKRKRDNFEANTFRKSAFLLNSSDEKNLPPRPPSMIERRGTPAASSRGVASPAHPGSAYPYSDAPPSTGPIYTEQNTHSFSQYGASGAAGYSVASNPYSAPMPTPMGPYGATPLDAYGYEQPGYGAPPMPGTYGPGAYAPYGTQSRFGAPGQYQPTPYYDQSRSQAPYPSPYGHGAPNPNPNTTLSSAPNMSRLPNPYGRSPSSTPAPPAVADSTRAPALSEKQLMMAASASASASSSGAGSFSNSANPIRLSDLNTSSSTLGSSVLNRQPTQSSAPPAYENDPSRDYQKLRRGEKPAFGVKNMNEESAASSRLASIPVSKSPSLHSLYDVDDAYGGM